LIIYS
jgi:hypothetical protein